MYYYCPMCKEEEYHEGQDMVVHCHQYPDDGSPVFVVLDQYTELPPKRDNPLPFGGRKK